MSETEPPIIIVAITAAPEIEFTLLPDEQAVLDAYQASGRELPKARDAETIWVEWQADYFAHLPGGNPSPKGILE